MNQSFINLRFEQIEKRFNEIDILLNLAVQNQNNIDLYQALCRSAHVLLVSHFEGLYKDICKDIIDDINSNTKFYQVKKDIFYTHCDFFILNGDNSKSIKEIKLKLWEAFKEYPTKLVWKPFLYIDNKNPTPKIIENILTRFGIDDFFHSIDGSDLDVVFEDQKSKTQKLRTRLSLYLRRATSNYPYTLDRSFYNPVSKVNVSKKGNTLWEDFLNNFLMERHSIIHGHTLDNPSNHESITQAKIKIEILLFVYIINLGSVSSPLFF